MKKVDQEKKALSKGNTFLSKLPSWLKILFLKYWVAGAAFYFFAMGGAFIWSLGADGTDSNIMNQETLRLILILGLGLTLFLDYILRPIVRMMRTNVDDTYYYNMVNCKGVKALLLHLVYAYTVTIICMALQVNLKFRIDPLSISDTGVDPFSMGFLFIVVDFVFLFIKNSIIAIYKRIRYKMDLKRQQKLLDEDDVPVYGVNEFTGSKKDNFLNDDKEETQEAKIETQQSEDSESDKNEL